MSRFFEKTAVFCRFLPIFSLGMVVFALERPVRAEEEGSGVIRGIAVDEQGRRLAQARIALTGETYWRSTESTDYVPPADPGLDFEFSGLPAGADELHDMCEGIAPTAVELDEGQNILENLRKAT